MQDWNIKEHSKDMGDGYSMHYLWKNTVEMKSQQNLHQPYELCVWYAFLKLGTIRKQSVSVRDVISPTSYDLL